MGGEGGGLVDRASRRLVAPALGRHLVKVSRSSPLCPARTVNGCWDKSSAVNRSRSNPLSRVLSNSQFEVEIQA
jgi:hypothetical protein